MSVLAIATCGGLVLVAVAVLQAARADKRAATGMRDQAARAERTARAQLDHATERRAAAIRMYRDAEAIREESLIR